MIKTRITTFRKLKRKTEESKRHTEFSDCWIRRVEEEVVRERRVMEWRSLAPFKRTIFWVPVFRLGFIRKVWGKQAMLNFVEEPWKTLVVFSSGGETREGSRQSLISRHAHTPYLVGITFTPVFKIYGICMVSSDDWIRHWITNYNGWFILKVSKNTEK